MIPAAHVVVGAMLPDGSPPLPRTLGDVVVWEQCHPLQVGDCPAWEFRDGAAQAFVTIQRVATLGPARAVWLAYVPAMTRGETAPLLAALADPLTAAGVLEGYWPVAADWTIGAVDSAEALAAWPASWRVRLPSDAEGDPPSGEQCVGAGLA